MITGLRKEFESRVRLGIMSLLMVHDKMQFNTIKETLDITDGNLASHMNALEKLGFVSVKKRFIGKKPNTSYSVTQTGRKVFNDHLMALEEILKLKQ